MDDRMNDTGLSEDTMTTSTHARLAPGVRVAAAVSAVLLAASACGGDDKERPASKDVASTHAAGAALKETAGLYHGVYVGTAKKSNVLVAVVAAPPDKNKKRSVTMFVCDGDKVVEYFPGAKAGNRFKASSEDGDARAEGTVTAAAVTGKVRLSGGRQLAFKAARGSGAAGLYGLEVNRRGALEGATEGGVAAKGRTTLEPGRGYLDLADGRRVRFTVRKAPGVEMDGEVSRVIVSPKGHLTGAVVSKGKVVAITGRPTSS
jgi:hypothetical protein